MDFLKKVSYVFVNKNVGLAIEFFSSILIVRYLGADDYGHYTTLYLLPMLVSSLGAFGFGPSIVYHINRGTTCVREYLYTFTVFGLLLGFMFVVIAALLSTYINEYLYEGLLDRNLFLIAVLFIPVVITQKYLRSIIRGIYEIKIFSLLLDVAAPIIRLLLILFILYGDYELTGMVITPVVVQAVITAYMFRYLIKRSADKKHAGFVRYSDFVVISKFAFKNYLGSVLQKSSSSLIMVIASTMLTFKNVGILSLAMKLLQIISGLSGAILTVLMPKVSRSKISEIQTYIPRVTSILLSFSVAILLVYLIFVEHIVVYLYGQAFAEVALLSIPLGIATILLPLSNVLMLTITFTGDPIKKTYARGVGLLVNLALCYPLYLLYGSLGFATSIGIAQITILGMALLFFLRKFKGISLQQLFVLRFSDIIITWKAIKNQIKIKEGTSKT